MKRLLFCLLWINQVFGQDVHFSQFYSNPIYLNPALTGSMAGKYRLSLNHRSQGVYSDFKTLSGSADFKFNMKYKGRPLKDKIGAGVIFFNDKVSANSYNLNIVGISASYHKYLNNNASEVLIIGVQSGIHQRNTGYDRLTFQDQFDGNSVFSLGTSENFPDNNLTHGDHSIGLFYSNQTNSKLGFYAGGAIHHFNQPQISFFYNENDEPKRGFSKLEPRYTIHSGMIINLKDNGYIQLLPAFIGQAQGPHYSINAGTNLRIRAIADGEVALQFGGWVKDLNAMVGFFGVEFNGYQLGMSWDFLSKPVQNNFWNRRNAFELSFSFTGNYEDELILCPKF
jgi:type IX secretion system PorP/SprF family membrane protein